jgi:hypothetical protein
MATSGGGTLHLLNGLYDANSITTWAWRLLVVPMVKEVARWSQLVNI